MDTSYSENWEFFLKLLNNYSEKALHDNGNFFEHQQAYALALFLANATLATPELNRCNVAELIAGKLPWPSSEGTTIFPGTQYSLAFFEDGGFISFPGGWVAVHCNEPQQTNQFDQSIEDILQVTNLLRNISFGRKGYVQPHFVIEETKLTALFNKELGGTQLERILPCVVKQGGMVNAYPERHQFTQLGSTYLWQCLLKRYSPEQAFRQWMLCIRTLSHYVIPVQFSLLEKNETDQFLHQVELLVKTAPEFSYPLRTIYKQSINSYGFARHIQRVTLKINLHPDSDNNMADKTDEPAESAPLTSMTAENLDGAYDIPDIDDPSDIIALGQWQYRGNWHDPMGGLSRLINSCFNHVITIDHNSLSAKSFAFNLLSLAESRQALKYMLFIGFPLSINCKYLLFLLSRPQTCEIAIYHLTNQEFLRPLIHRHDVSGDLSQLYLEALVEEYVRTIDNSSNNGLNLLKVSLYLTDNSGLYTLLNTDSFQYRALTCFMRKLEDKHVAAVASAFLENIPVQYEWRISHIKERSVYHLGLWLIQRLESTDITYHDLLPQLGECLIRYYSNAFTECITMGGRDLRSDNFFALLPWQSLIKVIGIREILRLSSRYDSWTTLLTYEHPRSFDAVSAICQYLQLLMLVTKGPLEENDRERAWQRMKWSTKTGHRVRVFPEPSF